ncbi:D-sedoheptulose 7-phosphate isomerase [Indioceanicola profundi]|uniref:D-sedoheptulose 7-phosphate isomerase n=1 Tax=Indioceanicola profundi TaxID=2220096 RepID=UPI000E6AC32D|nr:D-sedoheptulose 7-phosphate isomerase [Indioceanicola profundi]
MPNTPTDLIRRSLLQSAENFTALAEQAGLVADLAARMSAAIRAGDKIMFCGNGGSAADAQHLAAELLGRYLVNRRALPAIALTTDSSALTAIANDFGFDEVFSRQVQGLGRPGDVLVTISTSGNSPNILQAVQAAREIGIVTIGLTGSSGGRMADLCDVCLRVPSAHTPRIQEMHIAVGHMLCELVEADLA